MTYAKLTTNAQTPSAGFYTVDVTNSAGTVTSESVALTIVTATANPGRISNLAIRSQAGTGAQTLIVGLAISLGTTETKTLLLRGVGPGLTVFGVPGVLADPRLEVFSGTTKINENDNWNGDAQVIAIGSQVGAFALGGTTTRDAALYSPSFAPGTYTIQVTGNAGTSGVALAEIYDATPPGTFTSTTPRLVNVSARTQVGLGGDILIAGFVIGGSTSKTVLIRAVGPTLAVFGVPSALLDPKLEVFSGNTLIQANGNRKMRTPPACPRLASNITPSEPSLAPTMTIPDLSRLNAARRHVFPGALWAGVFFAVFAATTPAQMVRPPGPGGVGTVPVNPGTGTPGTTVPVNPAVPPGPRIATSNAVLLGESAQATAIIPNAGTPGVGGVNQAALTATYQWTISGGRITTDATRPNIQYVADSAGTLMLGVAITNSGTTQNVSAQVTVISAADAGSMTAPATVVTNAAGLTASVPPAQNADRFFRWTVSGAGAGIVSGQGTESLTFRAGAPGLLTVSCDVILQRLVTVRLRSFIVVTGEGAPFAVTVNGGSGGGTFPAGSRVDVFAHPPASGQVFDRWTGDVAVLGTAGLAPFLPHAVITVPVAATTLTATYKAAPAWTPTVVANFNPITVTGANATPTTVSTTLSYYIPAGAQGVVFLLHGSGANLTGWFSGPEQLTLARDLVAAGYGVAALNSVNRNNGTWNAQPALANNPDAANLAAALDKFARDAVLAATSPVFLLGFGSGADAAVRYSEQLATATPVLPIKGAILYCATGGATLAVTSRVPQFFAIAANDETLGPAGNADARENSQFLAGRGIATAVATSAPSPVHPGRFRALSIGAPAFTTADAQAVWTAVKNAGLLDANNYLKSIPTTDALRAALPAAQQPRTAEIAAQLAVAYGAREFYSDANSRVIAFLNARVAGTAAPAPGRMVNLSTRTKISYVGDSFALGFNISGPAKATLLIRGIGPALTRFGLPTALTAPRLEINQGSAIIATNEGWEKAPNAPELTAAAAAVGAFALAPGDADAAVLLTLDPGSYTATVRGLNGASGDVLAEVYDVTKNATRLTNLSTLAKIDEEGGFVTPGIVIQGANPRTIVARAVAPGLADFGIPTAALLGDPRITILNSTGGTVATNNNWSQSVAAGGQGATLNAVFPVVGAFALKATNSDAAVVSALSPGNFTLQASAAPPPPALVNGVPVTTVPPNRTGSVLVEVYEVP